MFCGFRQIEKLILLSRTNMEIIRCFLPVDFVTTEETTVEITTSKLEGRVPPVGAAISIWLVRSSKKPIDTGTLLA